MKRSSYLSNINFLIIDDNAFIRTTIRRVLETLGANRTHEAGNGLEALHTMAHWPVDIVLTDWEMAALDGVEFTKTVRRSDNAAHRFVPIIFVTAHSETWRIATARDAGVTEYMVKPISAATMFSRIRNVIEQPRPFISAPGYFGPDRRRRNAPFTVERRTSAPHTIAAELPPFTGRANIQIPRYTAASSSTINTD